MVSISTSQTDRCTAESMAEPERFPASLVREPRLAALSDGRPLRVKLSPEDLHRITLWLDCNSEFFGGYENTVARSQAARASDTGLNRPPNDYTENITGRTAPVSTTRVADHQAAVCRQVGSRSHSFGQPVADIRRGLVRPVAADGYFLRKPIGHVGCLTGIGSQIEELQSDLGWRVCGRDTILSTGLPANVR